VSGVRHSGDLKIGRDARLHAVGPDGDAVAMVFYDMKTGRGLKDARLIAAAPDLLEAAGLAFCLMDASEYPECVRKLKDAIARATGAA
jgi:hypothetical protein